MPIRQGHDDRLRFYADQLLILAAKALRDGWRNTAELPGGLSATAVPTAPNASGDERRLATLAVPLRREGDVTVSHTREVSLVLRYAGACERFGIDLERTTPERPRVASRIRSTMEFDTLPLDAPWPDIIRCFCTKEAAFKALAPQDQLGLTFRQLAVDQSDRGEAAWVRRVRDGHVVADTCVVSDANLVVAIAKAAAMWPTSFGGR